MDEAAIVVTDLWKTFRIPHEKRNTIFESLAGFIDGKQGYEEFTALKNINFRINKGEAIGIIGENGSGKSTLLKIISNILRPTRGTVKINGKLTPFLELGVGFQPNLTLIENINIYGAIMGLTDREINAKINEILDFSGLKRFEDAKLKNLSSGMQVRLAFATSIQTDPEILLMDEVLAVGDMEFQQKCIDVFQQYLRDKKTIIYVSHDLNSIRRFCSRSLLLRQGEQIAFGDTNEIIDKYIYGIDGKEIHSENIGDESEETEKNTGDKKKRWGNKKIVVTKVKFIDKYLKENDTFTSGDPMTICIFFDVKEYIKDLVFGMMIYDENGLYCYGTNTELKKYPVIFSEGSNEIDLIIDRLTMLQGKYYLTLASHSKSHEPYDWHDKSFSFNVINPTEDLGIFEVPCEWKMRKLNEKN